MSGPGERCEEEQHLGGYLVWRAHMTLSGPHQPYEYVAGLEVGECVKIFAHNPISLSTVTKARRALPRAGSLLGRGRLMEVQDV